VALPQPEPSETDPTVGGILPIPSLAGAHPAGAPPGAVWLTMCAWCGRLKVRDRWVAVSQPPDVIDASGLRRTLISHGICPTCFDEAAAAADRQRSLRSRP
jgi:hypothetical protein